MYMINLFIFINIFEYNIPEWVSMSKLISDFDQHGVSNHEQIIIQDIFLDYVENRITLSAP